MIAETISDLCIIGALGFVGVMLYKDAKQRKLVTQNIKSVEAALEEIKEVKKDFFGVYIQAKQEGQNLKDMIASAVNVISELRVFKDDISEKVGDASGYLRELDEAIRSADRSCNRIAETMSDASRRFAKINIQQEGDEMGTLKPISEQDAARSLKALKGDDTNILIFGRNS